MSAPEISTGLATQSPVPTIAVRRLDEETAANRRRYRLLSTVVVAVLAVVGALVGLALGAWPLGLGIGIALAILVLGLAPGVGERLALRTIGATPADPERFPRYQNLVEGLCEEMRMPLPKLWVVDSPAANALALGRGPQEATVVVTGGLLEELNRVELEAVVAAELSHIRSSSAPLGSIAVLLGGAGGLAIEARRRGGSALAGALSWPLTGLAPLRRMIVPVERHIVADEDAVYLTRYPPGLISALRKLASQPGGERLSNLGLNHLWIVDPLGRETASSTSAGEAAGGDASAGGHAGGAGATRGAEGPERFFPSHPPLRERIENLRDL
jgi:heat shock protein HtpX